MEHSLGEEGADSQGLSGATGRLRPGGGADGGALLAGRRPGHAWRVRSDCQLTAEWWGDGRRGGDRVTAVASQGDIKVA